MNFGSMNNWRAWLKLAAIVGCCAALSSAIAGTQRRAPKNEQTPSTKPAAAAKSKAARPQEVEVTGSLIKQKTDRNGLIATTTISPMVVIDQEAIRRTGASTVGAVLGRYVSH